MKIKIIIFLSFINTLVFHKKSYSQTDGLYFILASPYPSGDKYDYEYPSYLLKVNKNKLVIEDTLSTKLYYTKFVKVYNDEKFVVTFIEHVRSREKSINFLDFNKSLKNINKKIGLENWRSSLEESILKKESSNYKMVIDFFPHNENLEDKTELKLAIDLPSLTTAVGYVDYYSNAILTGQPGGLVESANILRYKLENKSSNLKIPITYDFSKRPVFEIKFPDTSKIEGIGTNVIVSNTKKIFAVNINTDAESENVGKKITFSRLMILNKSKNEWFRYNFPGNVSSFVPFGKWLSGLVCQQYIRNADRDFWESPGIIERKRKQYITGGPFDQRAMMYGVYQPGVLFLLDTETRNYLEWNTNQGDSEILLVHNEIIYYRVADKIYQRAILNGNKLSDPKIIVDDPMAMDIHWAFIQNR